MRRASGGDTFLVVAALRGGCDVPYAEYAGDLRAFETVLSTEEPAFAPDPIPPDIITTAGGRVAFRRPGAVILRVAAPGSTGSSRD